MSNTYTIELVTDDEAVEHNGFTLSLVQDDDAASPREDYNLGLWLGRAHRRYEIGDERIPAEVEERGPKFVERWIKLHYGVKVVVPVGMLDHGGLHFYAGGGSHWSDSHGWDSATCGWIFATKERLEETGWTGTDEELRAALVGEIETYDQWSRGEVFGYVLSRDGEVVDSCFGIIGEENATAEAHAALKFAEENTPKLADEWAAAYLDFYGASA